MASSICLPLTIIVSSIFLSSFSSAASLSERGACKDTSLNCEKWATMGMCRSDPDMADFMGRRCPFACDICSDRKKRRARAMAELTVAMADKRETVEADKRGCEDFSPKCEMYAADGLCGDSEISSLMAKTCPFACDKCKREVKKTEMETKNEEEKEGEEERKEGAMESAIEVSRKEVEDLMKEENQMMARSFAALISDAADSAVAVSEEVERRACGDFSQKCELYANGGLCGHRETSSLMTKTCPATCGLCAKRELKSAEDKRAICQDTKSKCETWAIHGMCNSDPDMAHFMAKTCPFACDKC